MLYFGVMNTKGQYIRLTVSTDLAAYTVILRHFVDSAVPHPYP